MGKRLILVVGIALAAFSCTSVRYLGPTNHVDYRAADNVKTSRQMAAVKSGENSQVSTYDEEYTYDAKGNLLKVKMTEYFDLLSKYKNFVVWETESKVLGGKVVPYRMSVNGVPFVEVDYELLTVAGNGLVGEDIPERNFTRILNSMWTGASIEEWTIAIDNYSVGFQADGRLVKEMDAFSSYQGFYQYNVLTLGYDNIVLTRFRYSYEKLAEGINKSFTGYNYQSDMLKKMYRGINVEYGYEWKVIADRICQTKMSYQSKTIKFNVSEEYNASGKRVKELWTIVDPREKDMIPLKIFEQVLTY